MNGGIISPSKQFDIKHANMMNEHLELENITKKVMLSAKQLKAATSSQLYATYDSTKYYRNHKYILTNYNKTASAFSNSPSKVNKFASSNNIYSPAKTQISVDVSKFFQQSDSTINGPLSQMLHS